MTTSITADEHTPNWLAAIDGAIDCRRTRNHRVTVLVTGLMIPERNQRRPRIQAVPPPAEVTAGTTMRTLSEAAEHLGVSIDAVRRMQRAGTIPSERHVTPKGFRWMVAIDGPRADTQSSVPSGPFVPPARVPKQGSPLSPAVADTTLLEAIRADHVREVDGLRRDHAQVLSSLEQLIATLHTQHSLAISALGAGLETLRNDQADNIRRLEVAHRAVLEVTVASTTREIDTLRRSLLEAKAWDSRPWWRWILGLPPARARQ